MEETSKKLASPLTEIPDHLLVEIFLRLPAPEDLARTSAACVSFRRLVTDRSFLRSFRRLHAPPLLRFLDRHGFHPAQPPHPSAPAARALALAADFAFSFLPTHCRWAVKDILDGRVLLNRRAERNEQLPVFTELVVCDPLHRLYVLLPPVPHDLAASLEHPDLMVRRPRCKYFFVPLCEEAAAAAAAVETSFSVICFLYCKIKLAAFVFYSSTGQWRAFASKTWSDLFLNGGEFDLMSRVDPFLFRRNYAYGCFYWNWSLMKIKKLMVLDTRRMEFSIVDIPPGDWSTCGLTIVEAGEGRLGIFDLHGGTAPFLSYTIARNKGESLSLSQCPMEKILLDSGSEYYIRAATKRYLLLTRTRGSSLENIITEYFSMDIKTLKLQRVCAEQGDNMCAGRIYTNYPPSLLSSPTI